MHRQWLVLLVLFMPTRVFAGEAPPVTITHITHGPMLGKPGAKQMGIWARTSVPGEFHVLYGTNGIAYGDLDKKSSSVKTTLDHDCTGWVLLADLKPNTKYYFRVATKDGVGYGGSFRTFPDPAEFKHEKHNPGGCSISASRSAVATIKECKAMARGSPRFAPCSTRRFPRKSSSAS